MLVIRFQRTGRTNDPAFRIVVTEKRSKPKSGEHEILGSFHPKTKETHLKSERILYWIAKGAQLSPRAHNLFVTQKLIDRPKINVVKAKKQTAPQETKEEKKESPAPAAA